MQLRYDTGTLSASQSIELETHETLPDHTAPIIFSIPRELARQQADIDRMISEMATAIDEGRNAEQVADSYQMSDACRQSIKAVAALIGGAARRRPQPRVGVLHPQHDPSSGNCRGEGGPHHRQPALADIQPEY